MVHEKSVKYYNLIITDSTNKENIKVAPQWNQVYTVKGVLSIPYAELEEPFYAW